MPLQPEHVSSAATTWEQNGVIRHRCDCGCVMEREPVVAYFHWRMVSYCDRHRLPNRIVRV